MLRPAPIALYRYFVYFSSPFFLCFVSLKQSLYKRQLLEIYSVRAFAHTKRYLPHLPFTAAHSNRRSRILPLSLFLFFYSPSTSPSLFPCDLHPKKCRLSYANFQNFPRDVSCLPTKLSLKSDIGPKARIDATIVCSLQ